MAARRGGLQLEEPSSRRAGLAGGEARCAQERRPRGRRAGRRPPAARRTGAPAARHTGAPALGGRSSEGRAGLPGTTGRARWRGEVGGGDGRGAEAVARREGAGPRPRGAPRAGAPAARPQGRAPAPGGGSLEGRAGLPGTTGRARRRGEVGGGDGTRESPSRRAEVGVGVWDWESRRGRLRVSLSSSRSWAAGPARFERWLVAARELARADSIRDRAKTLAWLVYIFLRAEPSH